ncbi:MAG: hypothetical protein ACM3RX_06040 [Methanococcaceae archaeon]
MKKQEKEVNMGLFSSIFGGSIHKSSSDTKSCNDYRVSSHPMQSDDCQRQADFKIGKAEGYQQGYDKANRENKSKK